MLVDIDQLLSRRPAALTTFFFCTNYNVNFAWTAAVRRYHSHLHD